jgi:flagellar hook assembly protein FlgD
MTISGKVVREITEDELGPLQIGRNQITNFAWDGKDQFGDPLANGIYLYRVIARNNGQEVKHRATEIDYHFKNEFGKMYLMR